MHRPPRQTYQADPGLTSSRYRTECMEEAEQSETRTGTDMRLAKSVYSNVFLDRALTNNESFAGSCIHASLEVVHTRENKQALPFSGGESLCICTRRERRLTDFHGNRDRKNMKRQMWARVGPTGRAPASANARNAPCLYGILEFNHLSVAVM